MTTKKKARPKVRTETSANQAPVTPSPVIQQTNFMQEIKPALTGEARTKRLADVTAAVDKIHKAREALNNAENELLGLLGHAIPMVLNMTWWSPDGDQIGVTKTEQVTP